ncbi:hypothetical protein BC832DRAFT_550270 [Gaertneriomyces semiglobifer]|nr:hypothetical protein BC832DRAFT_550270 [Gaertneriomyces semiglobifer]
MSESESLAAGKDEDTPLFDTTDLLILGALAILSLVYFFLPRKNAQNAKTTVGGSGSAVATKGGPAGSARPGSAEEQSSNGKKSIIAKLRQLAHSKQIVLFYGSQTGTAEDLASRIAKEATANFGVHALICDLEEYDMTELARWPVQELEEEEKKWLVGFVMATYGEGEPTDNAVEFYEWIMAGQGKGDDEGEEDVDEDELLENQSLEGVDYLIFGLGNRTYEHYNAIVRRLDKRLRKIGANRVGEAGEGDDDHSLEEDFLAWKPKMMEEMAAYFGVAVDEAGSKAQREKPHVSLFNITEVDQPAEKELYWGEHSAAEPRRWRPSDDKYVEVKGKRSTFDSKHPYYGTIAASKPLFVEVHDEYVFEPTYALPRTSHRRYHVEGTKVRIERHCLHIDLDIAGSGLKYETGDHVGVWPVNDEEHLQQLANVLRLSESDLDKVITLTPNKENPAADSIKLPFPLPCTVRTALMNYLDLPAVLKQYQLEILAKYATDQQERQALFDLADNRDLYVQFVDASRKDLYDILRAFPSVRLPLAVVLGELLPRIAVRYYSISSSSKEAPEKVGVTAVMVRYALPSTRAHHANADSAGEVVVKQGLATSWLQRLHETRSEGNAMTNGFATEEAIPLPRLHLPLYIRTSSFKLPRNPRAPVIMVGPGTGVAPFRAFVRERFITASTSPQVRVGPTWLFYGCRHPDKDFLYKEEFEAMERAVETGEVALDLKIHKAFSRYEGKKVYVQHLVRKFAQQVWEMMSEGGYFYICGDAKHMAHDVQIALQEIAQQHGGKTEEQAKNWIKDLKSRNRYLEDVWA